MALLSLLVLIVPVNMDMYLHFDVFVQERRNSIANALELGLSCTHPSILCHRASLKLYMQLPSIRRGVHGMFILYMMG